MPSSLSNRKRFRNLSLFDLFRYRLPLPGIVSILHRISGLFLFLLIPFLLFFWEKSVTQSDFFQSVELVSRTWFVRLILCFSFWAFVHHLLAGLRFLALDIHWGLSKRVSRLTSLLVLVFSLFLTVLFSIWLFL